MASNPHAPTTRPEIDKIVEFLNHLFLGTQHMIEVRALPSKATHFAGTPAKVAGFISEHWHENLYMGMATRKGGGRREHCRELAVIWTDLDFKDIPKDEALDQVSSFPIPPSIVVESGGGLHLYWLLAEPIQAHDPRVEPCLRGLARALGGDVAAAEIARIMRLPGTMNRKYSPP